MYYGSGTGGRCCICAGQTLRVCNHQVEARFGVKWRNGPILKVWGQSMRICLETQNNSAKFHPNPIWNDGALGFFEHGRPRKNKKKTRWVAICDQFLIGKSIMICNHLLYHRHRLLVFSYLYCEMSTWNVLLRVQFRQPSPPRRKQQQYVGDIEVRRWQYSNSLFISSVH